MEEIPANVSQIVTIILLYYAGFRLSYKNMGLLLYVAGRSALTVNVEYSMILYVQQRETTLNAH
jgi:hypothetical protein